MVAGKLRINAEEEILLDLLYLARHAAMLLQIVKLTGEVAAGSSSSAIAKHAADKIQDPEVDVDKILTTFQNLLRIKTRVGSDAAQVIDSLIEQCEQYVQAQSESRPLEDLKKVREPLVQALHLIGPGHPLEARALVDAKWLAERMRYATLTLAQYVETDPEKRAGVPVLRGTRFTVAQLLAELAEDRKMSEIATTFRLNKEQLQEVLESLSICLDRPA